MIAAALGLALALAAGGPPPLACPPGTTLRGARPMEGFEEWCAGQDAAGRDRREGPARSYYDDGTAWVESSFHEGLLDGPFVEWYRGGARAREGSYAKGEKQGTWRHWYPDGKLEEEASWKGGVLDGPFVGYWPSGKRRQAGDRCLGAQCGVWKAYDESGREIGSVQYGGGWREQP